MVSLAVAIAVSTTIFASVILAGQAPEHAASDDKKNRIASENFTKAKNLASQRKSVGLIELLRPAALSGHESAAYALSEIYRTGDNVPK